LLGAAALFLTSLLPASRFSTNFAANREESEEAAPIALST
jgi:hypothetical protein